jgi:threonine dehydrogenase-like Zn-dependent dehydrogenase
MRWWRSQEVRFRQSAVPALEPRNRALGGFLFLRQAPRLAEKPVADVVFEGVGVPGLIPQIMRAMPPRSRVTVALA